MLWRKRRYDVLERRVVQLTVGKAHRLYHSFYGQPAFDDLIKRICSGPLVAVLVSNDEQVDLADFSRLNFLQRSVDESDNNDVDVFVVNDLELFFRPRILPPGIRVRNVIVFGPPASGKGTQCELLSDAYDLIHISTGDLLRSHIRSNTDLGRQAKQYIERGELVPDSLITSLALDRIQDEDCRRRGFLLDGFPRSVSQARALLNVPIHSQITHFILLSCSRSTLIERSTGRRYDPMTGKIYHLTTNPPPPDILSRLLIRADDRVEVVQKRVDDYFRYAEPILTCFHRINPINAQSNDIFLIFHSIIPIMEIKPTAINSNNSSRANKHSSTFLAAKL